MYGEHDELHLRNYIHVLLRWLWLIVAIFVLTVGSTTILTFRQTPVYKATARILLEKTTPNVVSFADPGAVNNSWRDSQFLQTQINIIKSRAVIEHVLRKLGLMAQLLEKSVQENFESEDSSFSLRTLLASVRKFLGEEEPLPLSQAAQIEITRERILRAFLAEINVSPVRESRLVDISVVSINQEEAAHIANTLAETYIEYSLDAKVNASKQAVSWLVDEVETARQNVTTAEDELQKYKEKHEIVSIEGRENIVMQKLAGLTIAVNNAKINRMTLESEYREIQNIQPGDLLSAPQVVNDPVIQQLKIELLAKERDYLELLKTFRERHPTVVALHTQIEGLKAQYDAEISRIVLSVRKNYEIAMAQEKMLSTAIEEQKQEALALNKKTIEYGILQKEVESRRRIYYSLLERMNEMSVTERLETTNIQFVDRASIPGDPFAPKKMRSVFLAAVIGLLLGSTLAFFLEYWNDKLNTPEELKQYLEIPFLGMIPKVDVKHILPHEKKKIQEEAVSKIVLIDPLSSAAEAFRGLRTHMSFANLSYHETGNGNASSPPGGVFFLFTSPEPAEGKSCTVANLAITMAQSGRKTVIVDCDFRKPKIDKIFRINDEMPGLAEILLTHELLDEIGRMIYHTDIQNLDVIPCGSIPPNPSELLHSKKMETIFRKLGEQYEYILLDAPPINVVTDPMILSRLVHGVILVCHAGKIRREAAQRARDMLREAGANILGGVLNNANMKKANYYYAYHYPQYYREEKENLQARRATRRIPGSG